MDLFLAGPVQTLQKMLKEDQARFEIERELTERMAKRETQATREEVKRQVVKLLQEAGLEVQQEGPTLQPSDEPGEKEETPARTPRSGRPRTREPLPTLPFPDVTFFRIVAPRPKMAVHLQDSEYVLVETDADAQYDRERRIAIRTEPSCLELAVSSGLRGGRVRWRLRPRATAKAGDVGKIIVTLTKPDGSQLSDQIDFEVLPAIEQKGKKAKGFVPDFEIIPINPEDDTELWNLSLARSLGGRFSRRSSRGGLQTDCRAAGSRSTTRPSSDPLRPKWTNSSPRAQPSRNSSETTTRSGSAITRSFRRTAATIPGLTWLRT